MHFLPDVYVTCDVCQGKRFNRETLEVRYKGKNIAEVLDMTVDEARILREHARHARQAPDPDGRRPGLHQARAAGHHPLRRRGPAGQAGPRAVPNGHRQDALHPGRAHHRPALRRHRKLLEVLHRLVDEGNTVIVIEHNLDVIKTADYVIDLGPEGGDGGGRLAASGPRNKWRSSRIHMMGGFQGCCWVRVYWRYDDAELASPSRSQVKLGNES